MANNRVWAWPRISAALSHGPLRIDEITEEVYGSTAPENLSPMTDVLRRLVLKGRLVRVGRGWYALPNRRDEMQAVTKRTLAAHIRRQPSTIRRLAFMLDVPKKRAERWLRELAAEGYPLRSEAAPEHMRPTGTWRCYGKGGPRTFPVMMYWIEKDKSKERAA